MKFIPSSKRRRAFFRECGPWAQTIPWQRTEQKPAELFAHSFLAGKPRRRLRQPAYQRLIDRSTRIPARSVATAAQGDCTGKNHFDDRPSTLFDRTTRRRSGGRVHRGDCRDGGTSAKLRARHFYQAATAQEPNRGAASCNSARKRFGRQYVLCFNRHGERRSLSL